VGGGGGVIVNQQVTGVRAGASGRGGASGGGGGGAFGLASPQEMLAELGFRHGRNAAGRNYSRARRQ
jgi:hypothetical protein